MAILVSCRRQRAVSAVFEFGFASLTLTVLLFLIGYRHALYCRCVSVETLQCVVLVSSCWRLIVPAERHVAPAEKHVTPAERHVAPGERHAAQRRGM